MLCLPFKHAKGQHSKQLRPYLYMVQNYQFQLEIFIAGKWTVIEILFIFSVERNKPNNNSKQNSRKFSLNLTRKL